MKHFKRTAEEYKEHLRERHREQLTKQERHWEEIAKHERKWQELKKDKKDETSTRP